MAFAPSLKKGKLKKGAEKEEKLRLEVVMNLICILIPVLVAQQVTDYFRHNVDLPTRSTGGGGSQTDQPAPTHQPFNLKLAVGADNTFEIVNARMLGAGQGGLVPGPAGLILPARPDGTPNYRGLQELLRLEKDGRIPSGQNPVAIEAEYPDPWQITVTAPTEMAYQKVITVLDYVRFRPPLPPGRSRPDPASVPKPMDPDTTEEMFSVITLSPGSIGG
jgi:hypothetical protein